MIPLADRSDLLRQGLRPVVLFGLNADFAEDDLSLARVQNINVVFTDPFNALGMRVEMKPIGYKPPPESCRSFEK